MTAIPASAVSPTASAGAAAVRPVRIAGLGTATPPDSYGGDALVDSLSRLWPSLAPRLAVLFEQMGGGQRYLLRHPLEMPEPISPGEQTRRYLVSALELAEAAASRALDQAGTAAGDIGLLVVASCTGFVLPGIDVRLAARLGLRPDVVRMPFTQFGCAGGAAGLGRAAEWLRGHPDSAALAVAVELPSLTFRPGDTSRDNLLSALVFGDGAGAAVLEPAATTSGDIALGIGRVASILVPGTVDVLGYQLADDGLRVILSRNLAAILATALPGLIAGFNGDRALEVLAIHPGGPAILSAVQRSLGIDGERTAASWAALRRTGNTSSAGMYFVIEELERRRGNRATTGLAIAFGPGLTVEMLELTACS